MIYFVSDLHGNQNIKGLQEYLKIATEKDLLIILGDICLKFEDTQKNEEFTKYFLSLKNNIAFIDGNHENFTYLQQFPQEEWNGGVIRRLSDYIVYLQRGNVYTIESKTFFTFGGCKSSAKWAEKGLWSPEETATEKECELAIKSLQKKGLSVDYILTHKYEGNESVLTLDRNLYNLTQYIEKNVRYKKWYFGHEHKEKEIDEKHLCVHHNLIVLSE